MMVKRRKPICAAYVDIHTNQDWDEDCLYLDIFAPAKGVKVKGIMFWIHGGSFSYADDKYSGEGLVLAGDVIVIVVRYRLGVFGFLGAE